MPKKSVVTWIRFSIAALVYFLWVIWVGNYWLLLGLPIIFDIYISKKVPWSFWKRTKDGKKPSAFVEWADALIFALVAVYFINLFLFQNYKIPTSSLEKSLLVGDHLFVSKVSYGPRIPNTPLSFPLLQNTIPILNTKSYVEWPQWDYHRLKGWAKLKIMILWFLISLHRILCL
ncbi:S26 family signal peptidase [Saccharicrinis fermentans]|uniref:Signal peptidase I n=1 Tax=Saccharicrinis fermentans DSM 9555 = JCM 21142 TaxID=869213 RepID=W7Y9W3_9BACT|nr:S26 family signal peptidase [Saccharicrinis fermentans]GAF05102.1 signal peptidase I [Saccharicrinis fermentans DSM 9555 = JCM 21142]